MQLLLNEAIYRTVIVELLPQTRKFLWIVTADIKDWIDQLYLGEFCLKCQRRSVCPDPIV